jgi:DNA-directed RNA polymerase specialized sigma24 family protein
LFGRVTVDGAMRDPDEFDQHYRDVRGRLLLLTYCLTGDLPASRAAVRDAFVAAWHHWRKVSRLEDPEAWTRVRACARAQRRHTAKLWHREKDLDPEVRATLDALGTLPLAQRRVLLLTQLTQASLAEISREVGLPRTETERELQLATAQFSVAREVPTTTIRTVFEPVAAYLESSRWPRSPIIRRAGAARRRTHTVVGVVGTVAALVVTGMLVSDTTGVRPTLTGDRVAAAEPSARPTPEPPDLPETALLQASQVGRSTPGTTWTAVRTHDNTGGSGLVMPCQDERFADRRGTAAQVRDFEPVERRQADSTEVVQTAQASANERGAERGYQAALGWFAACDDEHALLIDTRPVRGVGDDATLFTVRTFEGKGSTLVAGVARTGIYMTTTFSRFPAGKQPPLAKAARLLGDAVSGLCQLEDAGACTTVPQVGETALMPAASVPGMLDEVDLPPVTGVTDPWVGTEPRVARTNAAATNCDSTDFTEKPITDNVTRTFFIPDAKLPVRFGLTQTVGSLPTPKEAAAFVATIRTELSRCSDRQMGTEVTPLRQLDEKGRELAVWRVTTQISDDETVDYLMGVVRDGTTVAQIGFVPVPKVDFAPEDFLFLVERALTRLEAMPKPHPRG